MISPHDRHASSDTPLLALVAERQEPDESRGEMRERIQQFEWSTTDLGSIESWCPELRTALSLCLAAAFPAALYWGTHLRMIYNDAWALLLGEQHPAALGKPAREVWTSMWEEVGTQLHEVLRTGKGMLLNDQPLWAQRGDPVEKHWSYSLTPICRDSGEILGVFSHAREMTALLRARQERELMLKRMREMFQQAPGAIAVVAGPEHVFEIANPAYERLVGRSGLIGKTVAEALPEVIGQGFVEILNAVYRSGEPYVGNALPVKLQRSAHEEAETRLVDFVYQPLRDMEGQLRGIFVEATDVTDRVRMEAALRASEERLSHALLAGGNIGTCDWDIRSDQVTADERFARLYGVDPLAAAKGVSIGTMLACVHPDDRTSLQHGLEDAMESGEIFEREFRLQYPHGSIRWVVARGRCTLAADGTPLRFSGVSFDVTDRKVVEQALRRSKENREFVLTLAERHRGVASPEEVMRSTAEALAQRLQVDRVGFCHIIDDDVLVFGPCATNERLPPLTGQMSASLLGSGLNEVVRSGETIAFADCRRDARVSSDTFLRIGTVAVIGVPLVRNGRWEAGLHVHHASPRDWQPEEISLVEEVAESAWDWSEHARAAQALMESEERFRAITNSIDQMIWSTRPDGYHDFYNDRWYEYTGVPPGSTDGEAWVDLFHLDDRDRTWKVWSHSLVTGEPYQIEYRLRHRSGHYRWVLGRAQPVRDHEGRIVRWFGTCTDIQDIVDAREVLARSREDLEREVHERTQDLMKTEEQLRQAQKMEAIGQLTGGIAHDFNNMLAVVQGGLSLLQRRLARGDTDVSKYVDGVMEGASRAAALTQRLLAFARQQPLAPEPLEPNRMVAGMTELLSRALGEDIRVETVLAPQLWKVRADPNQLENAIVNLAVNARDAMPSGGRLTIETSNVQMTERYAREFSIAPGEYVLLCVTDNGIGMTQDVIAKAFDPFFTTKEVGKGTGLGLSQVFGFVRQSGGHVKIDSEVGSGTTIKIYLPRYDGAAKLSSQALCSSRVAGGRAEEIVLVVEDEPRVRAFSVEALRELGYTPLAADGPQDALRIIDAGQRVDLLFTDIVMPELNGRQLVEQAKARLPNMKVLFTTGYSRETADQDSGTPLLPKPFGIEQLAAKVRSVLDAPG